MNAMAPPPAPVIPENAPFSAAQRSWLNGFLAGMYTGSGTGSALSSVMSQAAPVVEAEDFPWHDAALEMDERLALAEGKPLNRRLMAAMAQLDCGQCGYLCQTYGEALAAGTETSASLCVPGAKPTSKKLKALLAEAPATMAPSVAAPVVPAKPPVPVGLPVRVMETIRLTGATSAKDVRQVKIALRDSGLVYEPGDSIGIAAPNDPALVQSCISALGATGQEIVACSDGKSRTLVEALSTYIDIARPLDRTTDLLAMVATNAAEAKALRKLSEGDDDAKPENADLLDLIEAFPSARPALADLMASLPTLKPRLYSIASSLRATPGEVHLCVGMVEADLRGRRRHGVASAFLAHRASEYGDISATITTSHFRLPTDPATPVVMVGPGTGIAPFRAFLQERAALGVRGKSWLFFGDQRQATDFLFEPELRGWLADGTLAKLDTAFSRDQTKKVYVQHRMAEQAADLWRWLQDGAHFYVCGDATRMAKDVDVALRAIAMKEGRLDEGQARDWIVSLARQGRYQRDVY